MTYEAIFGEGNESEEGVASRRRLERFDELHNRDRTQKVAYVVFLKPPYRVRPVERVSGIQVRSAECHPRVGNSIKAEAVGELVAEYETEKTALDLVLTPKPAFINSSTDPAEYKAPRSCLSRLRSRAGTRSAVG